MAFWQSALWLERTESIYDLRDRHARPPALPFWREAVTLLRRARDFDVVVTMGARTSLAYGLLAAASGRPSKQIMTEVFIDDPKAWCPLWQLKTRAFRQIATRCVGVLANSSPEIASIARRFDMPAARLRFVPLNTTIAEPRLCASSGGYVLAAGRSLRDYETLLAAAPRIRAPVRIVCGAGDLANARIPPNVTLAREVAREDYLGLLERAAVVAVPLRPAERATGQVVVLEAMALGKPVVATRAAGTVDYIRHGENGLLVEPRDPRGLADTLNRLLDDPTAAAKLGCRAFEAAHTLHGADAHARLKLEAIRDLWVQASQ
jgi:glycosyltransferase involved in cell wall biosynthesis